MKAYQIFYLIDPDLTEEEAKAKEKELMSWVNNYGGIVEETTELKKRILGYEIKKKREAYFGGFNFEMEPEKTFQLKKELKDVSGLLRYMILKTTLPQRKTIFPLESFEKKEKVLKPKKVELEKIEEKLEEILSEEDNL